MNDIQQYAALVRQQQEHPSQWGTIEREKQALARRISWFEDARYAELREQSRRRVVDQQFWIGLVLVGLMVGMGVVCLAAYFEVLVK